VMKLLLAINGINPDSKNYNRTLLSRAAEKKYKVIIKLLLATDDIDLEFKNFNSRTPSGAVINTYKIDMNFKNSSTSLSETCRAD
jgi:ankyrin repeat protein